MRKIQILNFIGVFVIFLGISNVAFAVRNEVKLHVEFELDYENRSAKKVDDDTIVCVTYSNATKDTMNQTDQTSITGSWFQKRGKRQDHCTFEGKQNLTPKKLYAVTLTRIELRRAIWA